MNKKTLKIAGWALGLSMAVAGIRAAVAASNVANGNETIMAKADSSDGENESITFKADEDGNTESTKLDDIAESNSLVASVTGSKVYPGASGVKLGSSKASGSITLTLNEGCRSNVQSIKIESVKYGTDTGTLSFTADSTLLKSGHTVGTDFTHVFASPTEVNTIKIDTSSKRAYISRIIVSYASAEPSITLDHEEIEVTVGTNETVNAIPLSFGDGAVTYTFDTNACATLSHSGNVITVHGEAAGTHTFTITGLAGGVEQATVELVVTVVNPYPISISRTNYTSYTDAQSFADGNGYVTVTYSDSSTSKKYIGDDGVKLYISDAEVSASASTASYLGANSARISYTEEGHTVTTTSFTLNVQTELEILSFENVPEYLIIDPKDANHSATITVNYKSLNGAPELSIVSSNPAKLPLAFDEGDNIFEGTEGAAEFTITAGDTVGQYSVTVSATYGLRTETKSFSINVLGDEPTPVVGDYTKIGTMNELDTGNYVIAVTSGSVYGMTRSLSGGKYAFSSVLTVTDGKIAGDDGDDIEFAFSISGTGDSKTATIKNLSSEKYVAYASSTDLSEGNSTYTWTITSPSEGLFRITSGTSGRALVARTGSTNKFGGYATSNINGSEYYDISLFKYVEPAASSFDLVNAFVKNYMHMSDVSLGNNGDTGACKGDSGYYLTAKRAWNAMVTSYSGGDDLKTVFSTSFEDAYDRYNAWAVAMNDAQPFDGEDEVAVLIHEAPRVSIESNVMGERNFPLILAITSVGFVTLGGAFLISRRRKEDR